MTTNEMTQEVFDKFINFLINSGYYKELVEEEEREKAKSKQ